jgi:hypothetical protein
MKVTNTNTNFKPLPIPETKVPVTKPTDTKVPETKVPEPRISNDEKNRFLENLTATKLKSGLGEYLKPDASGKVHEEQLQFAIVNTMIANKSIKLADEFSKSFAKTSAAGSSSNVEENVKTALKDLVSQTLISQKEADTINGISFNAAQLDNNLTALYDNKGSAKDPTIAIASVDEALEKASSVIDSYRKGTQEVTPRPLSMNSDSTSQNSSADSTSSNISATEQTSNGREIQNSRSGFLWKPVSDSTGNLAVLLPPSLSGQVTSLEIHSSLPPSDSSKIENGKFSGNANGSRDHFRFNKPGSSFPDGSYVVARLNNGSYTTFQIGDSSARNT